MLREKIKVLSKIIQRVIIIVVLFVIYFFGFGITFIYVFIFNRQALRPKNKDDLTYWREAIGYEPDINDTFFQS